MFVAKSVKRVGNKVYNFYSLRTAVWDKNLKRNRQIYLAGLGPSRRITLARAKKICERLGITLDELRKVKGLKIIDETAGEQ